MAGVLQYALSLDTAQMTSALAAAQTSLAAAQSQLQAVGRSGDAAFTGSTRGSRSAAAGIREAAASAKSLTEKLSTAGATAANIWSGAKAVGEAWKATTKFFQNGGIAGALAKVKSGLATIARDPAMRRLALSAAAAATAIGGTYLALRSLRAASGGVSAASNALVGVGKAAGSATAKVAGLVGKLTGIGSVIGLLGSGATLLSALSKAADMETLNVSMEVLIGNADQAKKTMGELTNFAGATPFSTREVMEAGKNLLALGSSTETLTAELRALGDVSSGMQIPLKDMVDIYGKARTQGTLFAEDLNQLAGRGVPIFKSLAQVLGVSEGEIKKLASEGQITFPMLQKVFSDLTAEGGKFYKMMEKQSGTTQGLLSTLKSELDNLLISLGTPINDFLKPIIASNIGRMQALNQRVVAFLQLLSKARETGQLGEFLGASLKVAFIGAINTLSGGVRGVVAYLSASIPPIFQSAIDILASDRVRLFFESVFRGVGQTIEAFILRAVAKMPGMEGMEKAATAADQGAGMNFKLAKAALATADFEGTTKKLASDLQAAHQAAQEAYKDAIAKPLLDIGPAMASLANLSQGLDPKAWENLIDPPAQVIEKQSKTLEQTLGKLNTALEKATPKPAKPEATPKPPAMPNLGRVNDLAEGENRRRIRLMSGEDSVWNRMARRSEADKIKDKRMGGQMSVSDLSAIERARKSTGTRGTPLNPERAAERLARGNAAADPGRVRREERAELAKKENNRLTRIVESIDEKFKDLVTA